MLIEVEKIFDAIEALGMIKTGKKKGYVLLNDIQWREIKKRFKDDE